MQDKESAAKTAGATRKQSGMGRDVGQCNAGEREAEKSYKGFAGVIWKDKGDLGSSTLSTLQVGDVLSHPARRVYKIKGYDLGFIG